MLIPITSLFVEIELKRLLYAVYSDKSEEFNYFENDIFILSNPFDEEQSDYEIELPIDFVKSSEECEDELKVFDDEYYEELIDNSPHFIMDIPDDVIEYFQNQSEEESEEEFSNKPNFHYKINGFKMWWNLGNEEIYANKKISTNHLTSMITQCILSTSRRTEKYLITDKMI